MVFGTTLGLEKNGVITLTINKLITMRRRRRSYGRRSYGRRSRRGYGRGRRRSGGRKIRGYRVSRGGIRL